MKMTLTADLCDAYMPNLQVVKPIGFKNYGKKKSFHGQIVTVKVFEANELIRAILEEDGKGKVLVVDGAGSDRRALVGGNIAAMAQENGWSGVLINGAIRDVLEIAEVDMAVLALYSNPYRSAKELQGERDLTLHFADADFIPGHFIYADEDGIVLSEKELS